MNFIEELYYGNINPYEKRYDNWDGARKQKVNGYSYGELVDIANCALWQYRDMYLRPDFYANNLEKVRTIIAPVIEDYKTGKITYAEAEFNARNKIYQSVKPDFNPDIEYMKDPLSRDIPSVDNSLFIIARKLLLDSKS